MELPSHGQVARCSRVRSTLLATSVHALRLRGHADAYAAEAGEALVATLAGVGAPSWLPVEVAESHYAACDRLGLAVDEILAIGAAVAPTAASGIQVLLRVARGGGVTPWTALENLPRYWSRMYDGSAARAEILGPKDAQVVVEGHPLARFAYWRTGLRGIIAELTRALSTRAYVRELSRTRADGVIYSVAWA